MKIYIDGKVIANEHLHIIPIGLDFVSDDGEISVYLEGEEIECVTDTDNTWTCRWKGVDIRYQVGKFVIDSEDLECRGEEGKADEYTTACLDRIWDRTMEHFLKMLRDCRLRLGNFSVDAYTDDMEEYDNSEGLSTISIDSIIIYDGDISYHIDRGFLYGDYETGASF